MNVKIKRRINRFWYKKIGPCKKCGGRGYLARHGNKGWMIGCLGSCCTNSTDVHASRLGALKEWNK